MQPQAKQQTKKDKTPVNIPTGNVPNSTPYDVTAGVFGIRTLFVNVFFVGAPGKGNSWTLIDAGFYGYADPMRERAEQQQFTLCPLVLFYLKIIVL